MIQFQENAQTDGRWEGRWIDVQTLFYKTLPTAARGPKIETIFMNTKNTKTN